MPLFDCASWLAWCTCVVRADSYVPGVDHAMQLSLQPRVHVGIDLFHASSTVVALFGGSLMCDHHHPMRES